jgi:hypothetical protein
MLGNSRCPHDAEHKNNKNSIRTKTCTHRDPDWKNTKVGGVVQPKCLRALFVADPPAEDVLRVSHHLRLGDLALEGLKGGRVNGS